jgi:hypothetical protein
MASTMTASLAFIHISAALVPISSRSASPILRLARPVRKRMRSTSWTVLASISPVSDLSW